MRYNSFSCAFQHPVFCCFNINTLSYFPVQTTCHNERCSLNLQSCKENITEQGKPILVDISKGLGTPSSFLQEEACGEGKIDKQMGLKPKKLAKYPQVGLHFGRNHLFLSSLNLRLINKFKKRKKPHLSSKNSPKDNNIILDSHGASTSEATENVSVHKHSHLEHSCSGLIKADNAKNVKWRKYSNGESLNVAGGEELNSIKNAVLDPNQLPRTCLDTAEKVLSSRVIDADDKLLPRHDFLKLMMGGLKETTGWYLHQGLVLFFFWSSNYCSFFLNNMAC